MDTDQHYDHYLKSNISDFDKWFKSSDNPTKSVNSYTNLITKIINEWPKENMVNIQDNDTVGIISKTLSKNRTGKYLMIGKSIFLFHQNKDVMMVEMKVK